MTGGRVRHGTRPVEELNNADPRLSDFGEKQTYQYATKRKNTQVMEVIKPWFKQYEKPISNTVYIVIVSCAKKVRSIRAETAD